MQKFGITKSITCGAKLKIFSVFFFLHLFYVSAGQYPYYQDSYMNVEEYSVSVFPPEFDKQFKDGDDKKNFKKLREFLNDKQQLFAALTTSRSRIYGDRRSIPFYENKIQQINTVIDKKSDDAKVLIYTSLLNNFDSATSSSVSMLVTDIKEFRDRYIDALNQIKADVSRGNKLDTNLNNVKDDIRMSQKQLDSTLAPEYKQQAFRTNISICFTILIAILLIVFFAIVYKKSDNTLSKDLLSGNGLQFVTLFVLIIAIILFGILSILGSSELAAILSGISGYILGKGTQKDLAATLGNNPPSAVLPPAILNLTSISPGEGATAGGTLVRIAGTGFSSGAVVKIGGINALASIIDSSIIVVKTPAHAIGTVEVVVINTDGKSVSLANGFKYI